MHIGACACIFKHKKLQKDDLLFSENNTSSCTLQIRANFVILDALGVNVTNLCTVSVNS